MINLNNKDVTIVIPCLLNGGTELQSLNLIKALINSGYQPSLLCFHEYNSIMVKEFEDAGCKVVLTKYSRALSKFTLFINLYKYFRREKSGIVHVQYLAPAALVILAARLAGVRKVLATVHQMGDAYGFKEKLLMRISSWLCTRFIFVSIASQRSWIGKHHQFDSTQPDNYKKRIGTIYNAIENEEINRIVNRVDKEDLKRQLGIGNKYILGAVSRLRYEKGIDILLDAFIKLMSNHTAFHLLIIGDGPDKNKLMTIARNSNIISDITWIGELEHKEALEYMGIMDVVVIPSRNEGFGLTAIEAMAIGKPVIASNTGGLAEIIRNKETGLLVTPGNPSEIVDSVLSLYTQPDLRNRISSDSRNCVKDFYDFGKYQESIRILYQSINK